MAHLANNNFNRLSGLFNARARNSLKNVPTHLLADCGFEGVASAREMNNEIDRLTLTLSSLR